MRFGDGAWRMLEDVVPHYLSRVDGFESSERQLLLVECDSTAKERLVSIASDRK